ncbi:MAG TPA: GTP 3',8-cyclase MoaA [Deltaproteobacteria bacterium]|nr:GTP 3',8-cyclase MoaA [Deltaproteobacteria bacterium]
MLTDKFNRIIDYVRISITDRCNLRCRYCVNEAFQYLAHDEILRYEEIIRFVRIVAQLGVKKVRLTGGEPLVRKGISYLLKTLSAIHGINDISLTTNGVFLAEKIEELKDAGLHRINISLDSLKRERFHYITQSNTFDLVLKGIDEAIRAGLNPVKINTVIIKGFNDDEIFDFAKLALDKGIHIRFIEFMPFGDSTLWDGSRIVPSDFIESLLKTKYTLEPTSNMHNGPAKMFTIEKGTGKIGFISPLSSHICSECNRIRLTSRGMIRPCLFSEDEYDVKSLLRNNRSDEEIKAFIKNTVKAKPEKKVETGFIRKCQQSMRHIGG